MRRAPLLLGTLLDRAAGIAFYLLLAVAAAYLIAVFITAIWDGQGGTF